MAATKESLPKVTLMAVATLSGVSAEPILMFPNTAASADHRQWGKTSFHPSQEASQVKLPENAARHQAHVAQAVATMAPHCAYQEALVARRENLERIAGDQAREAPHTQSRSNQKAKETVYER